MSRRARCGPDLGRIPTSDQHPAHNSAPVTKCTHIDVGAFAAEHEPWFNRTLTTVTLDPHQAITISKGVVHRTRAPERTVILMVEPAGVVPTGD